MELPLTSGLDADAVGRLLARALAVTDLIHADLLELMGELRRRHAKIAAESERTGAGVALLARYAADLEEISATPPPN
jgi:hypothetical protein